MVGPLFSGLTAGCLMGTLCATLLHPSLLRAVGRRYLGRSVADAVSENAWVRDITGPFTVPVLLDYLRLWGIVQNVQLTVDALDVLRWSWSASMSYSSSSAYQALFLGASRPLGAKELWKVSALAKVKHFFWLALHRKCWTAARRHRHGLQTTPNYVLCVNGVEEIDHILLSFIFSHQVWSTVLGVLGLHQKIALQQTTPSGHGGFDRAR